MLSAVVNSTQIISLDSIGRLDLLEKMFYIMLNNKPNWG